MENKWICMVCYKPAVVQAYGNTYCKDCFEQTPYYAERKAAETILEEEKAKRNEK